MITKDIIRHLTKDVSNNDKDIFISKSIHIASITKMAAHQGVELFDICACSGRILVTNQ